MVERPINLKCNNDCISCIFDTRQVKYLNEPSTEKVKELIKNWPSKDHIGFTGGEPTLQKDLFELIEFAHKLYPKTEISLFSNGRKFSEKEFTEKLSKLDLKKFKVCIPIYSHRAEVHDYITRVEGSWKETVKGIKELLKRGIAVELRVIVQKANYTRLEKTAEFIARELSGVFRVIFINVKYSGNAFINRDKIFVRYKELVPFVQKAVDALEEAGIYVKLFHFPFCTVGKKYWKNVAGITKDPRELTLLEKCLDCAMRKNCPRIWKTYLVLAGEEEFRPVKK